MRALRVDERWTETEIARKVLHKPFDGQWPEKERWPLKITGVLPSRMNHEGVWWLLGEDRFGEKCRVCLHAKEDELGAYTEGRRLNALVEKEQRGHGD